jgi:ATP-dependent Lon protease
LDTIPRVLADRMEVIRLSGYIEDEKYQIAKRYLLPKQLMRHGLKRDTFRINKRDFIYIINNWAREAGVRSLERQIEKICRRIATMIAKGKKIPQEPIKREMIREYLGSEIFSDDEIPVISKPGIAIGLAWTSLGGATLVVESIGIENEKGGKLELTGQLGDVMTESANIAYSYVQKMLENEKSKKYFNDKKVHIHVPAGATPKDGPSAGITMATSLFSLVTGRAIRPHLAMTGELTLSGRILPVGGIKEKLIAAKRATLKEIILPEQNKKDISEIPDYIKKGVTFHFVNEMSDIIRIVFPEGREKRKRRK